MAVPRIFEQTLRDGLMGHSYVSTEVKLELIDRLIDAGIDYLELVRFPISDEYAQFSDALTVLEAVKGRDSVTLAAFAMGTPGVEQALEHEGTFHELHVPCFATDAYGQYALGEDWADMRRRVERAQRLAHAQGVKLTVGLGTSLGCPIDRTHRLSDTITRFRDLVSLGVDCIMLGDTAGMATPADVRELLAAVNNGPRPETIRVHFHNTHGRGLLNTWTAIEFGVDGVDCSLLGLGGEPHPYFITPHRVNNGNCATEEVIELLAAAAHDCDSGLPVSREAILGTARWLFDFVEGDIFGRAAFAKFVPLKVGTAPGRH